MVGIRSRDISMLISPTNLKFLSKNHFSPALDIRTAVSAEGAGYPMNGYKNTTREEQNQLLTCSGSRALIKTVAIPVTPVL